MFTRSSSTSIVGYVSDLDRSSSSRASQRTVDEEPEAPSWTFSRPRYEVRPEPRETDLDTTAEVVFGATWTNLPPASWCCPSPANATEVITPWGREPIRSTDGDFFDNGQTMLLYTHPLP